MPHSGARQRKGESSKNNPTPDITSISSSKEEFSTTNTNASLGGGIIPSSSSSSGEGVAPTWQGSHTCWVLGFTGLWLLFIACAIHLSFTSLEYNKHAMNKSREQFALRFSCPSRKHTGRITGEADFTHKTIDVGMCAWDASHYLYIAERGYPKVTEHPTHAFPCGFPYILWGIRFAVYLVSRVVLRTQVIALVVNVLCFVTGLYLWARYTQVVVGWGRDRDSRLLPLSIVGILSLPGLFFFIVPYAESGCFVLLAIMVYTVDRQGRRQTKSPLLMLAACVACTLLPLFRSVTIFISIPLCLHAVLVMKEQGWRIYSRPSLSALVLLPLPALGYAVQLFTLSRATQHWFSAFSAQQFYVAGFSLGNVLRPYGIVLEFLGIGHQDALDLHSPIDSILDRVLFIVFLVLLVLSYRATYAPIWTLALVLGAIPPLLGSFMSFTRFLILAAPWLIPPALSSVPRSTRLPIVLSVAVLGWGVQAWLAGRWINFLWAG